MKKIIEKTWVNGGQFVYGDNPFREALYALEDELIWLENEDGKFIPKNRMSKVMNAYEKFLKENHKKSLSQQKEELLLEGEKNMAKGVLRRIEKGKSLEHIKVLCETVLK